MINKLNITILLTVFIITLGYGQSDSVPDFKQIDCRYDAARRAVYEHMEVFNWTTEKYEKFKKAKTVYVTMDIYPKQNTIILTDTVNAFLCRFYMKDCLMTSDGLIYYCHDNKNKQDCTITLSATDLMYLCTVKYQGTMYRLKQLK